jgi:sugar phosphate isomerase/epimerase
MGEDRVTRVGFCSISALDRPLARAAEAAAAAGLDGLEVTDRPPHLEPDAPLAAAREAGRAIRVAGIDVMAYGSYLGRSGPRTPEHAAREAARAEALGAPLLRMWAEPEEGAPDGGFDACVRLVAAACDAAAPRGIDVVVERHVGSFVDTPERIERLFAAVARPNLALNYQVLDFLPPGAVAAQPDDARRLVPLARYFHLKNSLPNPDGGPLLPGGSLAAGAVDQRALLAAAFEAGYAGPLVIEFLSFEALPLERKLAADADFVRGVLRALGRG